MLRQEAVDEEEEALRQRARALDEERRQRYFALLKSRVKDPDTYATLNYFFVTGLHHFYLEKWLAGLLDLGLFVAGVLLIVLGLWPLGVGLIVVISILELWALFRAQIIVQDYNNRLARQILNALQRQGTAG
jgi:TM2 domain-containing membrane protein YozV